MAKNLPYDVTHNKHETQNEKKFFHWRLKYLPSLFEGVNSSLVQSTKELCAW